eukprot:SAG31_NODE_569_length_14020_cov_11.049565_1_plen_56_part_10
MGPTAIANAAGGRWNFEVVGCAGTAIVNCASARLNLTRVYTRVLVAGTPVSLSKFR